MPSPPTSNHDPRTAVPALRLVVVGARTVRQGIGRHLARHAHAAGARIVGVVGSSIATAREAAADLAGAVRGPVDAFPSVAEALTALRPDGVIVASPNSTHEACLEAALAASCHALVDKPVLALAAGAVERADALALLFQRAGLVLAVHAQWPFVLPAFAQLAPPKLLDAPSHVGMGLSPTTTGRQALEDSAPHLLSLLAALLPGEQAEVEEARFARFGRSHIACSFRYRVGERTLAAALELEQVLQAPRPAWLAIDGFRADRAIEEPGYRLRFVAPDGRSVPVPDPSRLLVASFLERIGRGDSRGVDPALRPGMRCLETLLAAAPATAESSPAS